MQRPRYSADDFKTVTAKIRYDLTAAQAKLTDLTTMIASLNLPTDDKPVSEETLAALVQHTRHEYTDASLRAELQDRGADPETIDRLLNTTV